MIPTIQKEKVNLPRALVNQLLHHAQSSPGDEICGLIGSQNGAPTTYYPIKNVSDTPTQHFLLDAAGQINSMRVMRETQEELFGIYHSHPTSPAEPSATDIEMANYPDALYLIISLNTKGVLEMRGFRLNQYKEVSEVELLLKTE